jgi:hypothetical protein
MTNLLHQYYIILRLKITKINKLSNNKKKYLEYVKICYFYKFFLV